jgi:uncharacterized membrane protein required for colicin V production
MNLDHLPLNWFDATAILLVLVGVNMGRKRGMTEELFLTSQWIAIVFAGAYLYRPLGDFLVKSDQSARVFGYVGVYAIMAVLIKISVGALKTRLLEKLQHLNLFGGGEYYFGMVAGAIRYGCMLIFGMALLNAPVYTYQERLKIKAATNENYGSDFFPETFAIQDAVFKESFIGSAFKNRASVLLIAQYVEKPVAKHKK